MPRENTCVESRSQDRIDALREHISREKKSLERRNASREKMPRGNRYIDNRLLKNGVHFSWPTQYLEKIQCDLLWQALDVCGRNVQCMYIGAIVVFIVFSCNYVLLLLLPVSLLIAGVRKNTGAALANVWVCFLAWPLTRSWTGLPSSAISSPGSHRPLEVESPFNVENPVDWRILAVQIRGNTYIIIHV